MRRMSLTGLTGLEVSTEAEVVNSPAVETVPTEPVNTPESTTVVVDTPPAGTEVAVLEAAVETPAVSTEPAAEPADNKEVALVPEPEEPVVDETAAAVPEETPAPAATEEPAPAAEVPAEVPAEETPVAETPVEETPAAEPAAEPVVDTPAEPAAETPEAAPEVAADPVEETSPEEAPADAPAAEVPAAEVPAEEPAADIPADVPVETPGEEPAAVPETPAEEVPVETPADPEVPAVAEEPAAEPVEAAAVPAEETPVVDTPADPEVDPEEIPVALQEETGAVDVPAQPAVATAEPLIVPAALTEETTVATPDVIVQAGAELGSNTDSLAADLDTLEDQAAEADEHQAKIDETEAVVEALEQMVDVLEGSVKHNGLDASGAALLSIATEHMFDTVGFSTRREPTVSLESFTPGTSIHYRRISTESAVENLKAQISKIIAAIKKAIADAIEWLINRFKKITDATVLVEERAKAVLKKAAAFEENTNAPATFQSPYLAGALRIGKMASPNVPGSMNTLFDTTETILGTLQDRNESIAESLVVAVEKQQMGNLKALGQLARPVAGFKYRSNPGMEKDGMRVATTTELLGGQCVYSLYPADAETVEGRMNECRMGMMAFDQNELDAKHSLVKRLTVKEAEELANTVLKITKIVASFKENVDRVKSMELRCSKAADHLAALAEHETDEFKADLLHFKTIARNLPRILTQPAEEYAVYTLRTCKAALELADMSVSKPQK